MKVFVRTGAEVDLASARDWYDQQRPGLGMEFLDEVNRALAELQAAPDIARLYYGNFRRVLLRRFPYKIFYQVIEARIVVFRILHAKQTHSPKLDGPLGPSDGFRRR